MNNLTYRTVGDYQLPNLILPHVNLPIHLGKYALLRKTYLERHRRVLYINLLTSCTLEEHLMEMETQAQEMIEQITGQLAQQQGVTEQLKATNQMKWVAMMNNIRHTAEETALSTLVYS